MLNIAPLLTKASGQLEDFSSHSLVEKIVCAILWCKHSFKIYLFIVHAQSLSHIWLFVTPWTAANQAPLSMGFSRQEHWSGLPFPPPEDLPHSGMEPASPALASKFFTSKPPRKPITSMQKQTNKKQCHVKCFGECKSELYRSMSFSVITNKCLFSESARPRLYS